jgi:hypothetical protein
MKDTALMAVEQSAINDVAPPEVVDLASSARRSTS